MTEHAKSNVGPLGKNDAFQISYFRAAKRFRKLERLYVRVRGYLLKIAFFDTAKYLVPCWSNLTCANCFSKEHMWA
jgi:hypothetical protein